jgi:hypothetical protein
MASKTSNPKILIFATWPNIRNYVSIFEFENKIYSSGIKGNNILNYIRTKNFFGSLDWRVFQKLKNIIVK